MNNNNNQTNNDDHPISDDHPRLSTEILNVFSKATMIELTSSEKEKGYNTLKSFMENQEVADVQDRATMGVNSRVEKDAKRSILSPYLRRLSLCTPSLVKSRQLVYMLVLGCFIFSLVAGCAQAAQDSLPGDLLYPIKIQVNERLERALASNTETRARVAVKQAVTRLKETEKLIASKKIDVVRKTSIDADVAHTSSYVADSIVKLKAEGQADLAIQISSDFEDLMSNHERNISDALKNAPEDAQKALATVQDQVRARIALSATMRADLEGTLTPSSKIRKIKESAISELDYSQKKIEYAEKFVQTAGVAIKPSAEEDKNIQQNIEYIKRTVAKGKEKLNVGAYTDAFILFKDAGKNAEQIDKQIRNLNGLKKSETDPGSISGAVVIVTASSTQPSAMTATTSVVAPAPTSTSVAQITPPATSTVDGSASTVTAKTEINSDTQANPPTTMVTESQSNQSGANSAITITPIVITPPVSIPTISTGVLKTPGL